MPRLACGVTRIAGGLVLGFQGNCLSRFLDFRCGLPGDVIGGLTDRFLLHGENASPLALVRGHPKLAIKCGVQCVGNDGEGLQKRCRPLANNGHVPEGAVLHRYAGIPVAQYLPGSCQSGRRWAPSAGD
jgi:hypothetical protein